MLEGRAGAQVGEEVVHGAFIVLRGPPRAQDLDLVDVGRVQDVQERPLGCCRRGQ